MTDGVSNARVSAFVALSALGVPPDMTPAHTEVRRNEHAAHTEVRRNEHAAGLRFSPRGGGRRGGGGGDGRRGRKRCVRM